MSVAVPKAVRVFVSYSHDDARHFNRLAQSLRRFRRKRFIEEWHDRKIVPGQEWEETIDENLEAADVILLLVSPDFVNSDYAYYREMRRALERHERGEAAVIPIIVRPTDWEEEPFSKLEVLPTKGRPITEWSNRDQAWLDVERGIRKTVEALILERQQQSAADRYRKAVEEVWADNKVSGAEAERLAALVSELGLSTDTATNIERDIMGDTVQPILQRQAREREEERQRQEATLRQYREGVEAAWANRELDKHEVKTLRELAENLKVDSSDTVMIEREVMGESKEAVLERQEQAAMKEQRNRRLQELYTQARKLHRDQEWQTVIGVLEQIRVEEPNYRDTAELLESAREALKLQRRVAQTYDRGLRHMDAEEWTQALECFEEVQRLEPGYQAIEDLLLRVREALTHGNRWEFVDFDLEIQGEREPGKYPVAARSSGVEATAEMRFPFDERELKDKLRDLEVALLRSGTTRRRLGTRDEQTVQEFGRVLFDALLIGDVRAHYERSLREARQQNKGLRLKLHVRPPELLTLPWEFLYDPERDYIGLSSMRPLVRYLDAPQAAERLSVTLPLRILGMVAKPNGVPQLDVEREKRLMEEATKDLRADGMVQLTWLEGQTWRDLLRQMRREGDWHVLHFIGHGGIDSETEEGAIALADEKGREYLLRATALARLLENHYPLRLVFLNSCEGASGSESDAFSSVAATLVHRGVPAVVAMQYEVTDKAAIEFSRGFYEAVADGLPVDAAVADARTAVSMSSALEWGTPVLYMRSSDGLIFDIQKGEFDYQRGDVRKGPDPGRFKTLPGWESGSATSSSPNEQEPRPGRFKSLPGW